MSFDLDTAERQHLLPFQGTPYVTDHAAWVRAQTAAFDTWKNAYWFTHQKLGSRARAIYGDVYDLPDGIGTFDVVILGAILEHLGDPVRAIGSIARVASKRIVINTDIISGDEPIGRFNGDPAYPERSYIFWTYTLKRIEESWRSVVSRSRTSTTTPTRRSLHLRRTRLGPNAANDNRCATGRMIPFRQAVAGASAGLATGSAGGLHRRCSGEF